MLVAISMKKNKIMTNHHFQFPIAPFEVPKDGKPLVQIGDFTFQWEDKKFNISIAELSHELYFDLYFTTSDIAKAIDSKLLSDYNNSGEVDIKFSLSGIFDNYIPNGATSFFDGRSEEYQPFYLSGTDYSLTFSGTATCREGWVGINGYLQNQYDEKPPFTVKIYQKIDTKKLDWTLYTFSSIEETATARPETVRHLSLKNPGFEKLPEQIFSFVNLEKLSIERWATAYDADAKLPLKILDERIGELTNLKSIHINSAALSTLPASIGKLTKLEHLGFPLCNLTHIPLGIWQHPNLRMFYIQQNHITEIPDEVHLENLTQLDISGNSLKTLPVALLHSKKLTNIEANRCSLNYLPPEFSNFKGLQIEFEVKKKLLDLRYKNPDGIETIAWNDKIFFAENEPEYLKELVKDHGLEKYHSDLKNIIKKAVGFKLTGGNVLETGIHRFGGRPDLPLNFEYPTFFDTQYQKTDYYEFLAQINCEKIAHLQAYLPRTGTLFFFLSTIHDFGMDTDYPIARVLYAENNSEPASGTRFSFKEDDFYELTNGQYESKTAEAFEKFSLPSFYNIGTNAFQFEVKAPAIITDSEIFYDQIDFEEAFENKAETDHGINTNIFTQHENPELQAAIAKGGNPEDWMVLLQLKSRGDFQWGDAGDLFFVIHKSDLAQKNFNNVYVGLESS